MAGPRRGSLLYMGRGACCSRSWLNHLPYVLHHSPIHATRSCIHHTSAPYAGTAGTAAAALALPLTNRHMCCTGAAPHQLSTSACPGHASCLPATRRHTGCRCATHICTQHAAKQHHHIRAAHHSGRLDAPLKSDLTYHSLHTTASLTAVVAESAAAPHPESPQRPVRVAAWLCITAAHLPGPSAFPLRQSPSYESPFP